MEPFNILINSINVILLFILLEHFIRRHRESPRKEQWYFIYLFSIYLCISMFEIYEYFHDAGDDAMHQISYISFLLIVSSLTAAGMALNLKFRLGNIIILVGLGFAGVSTYLYQQGLFDDSFAIYLIILNLVTVPWFISLGILMLYFTIKTRLSPILGLLIAIGILALYSLGGYFITIPFNGNVPRLLMLIFMILGIKGKLNFFEISDEEKIQKKIPVLINPPTTNTSTNAIDDDK